MTKVLITYFSMTGNTRKIAEAMFQYLKDNKTIKPVEEVLNKDIETSDLIFIGFPVHSHSVPIHAENLLKKIPAGKKIALFSTHGSLTGSRLSREALEHASVLASRAQILGTFSCRGKVALQAMDALRTSPEHKAWVEMSASAQTHPDNSDLEDARDFVKWIMTLNSES
jgi:flavodoxin